MAVPNLTSRVLSMSAHVLHITPTASPAQVAAALTRFLGTSADFWLEPQMRATPADPVQARAVCAARVLTRPLPARSHAVVAFLAADHKVPPMDRLVPDQPTRGNQFVQMALVS